VRLSRADRLEAEVLENLRHQAEATSCGEALLALPEGLPSLATVLRYRAPGRCRAKTPARPPPGPEARPPRRPLRGRERGRRGGLRDPRYGARHGRRLGTRRSGRARRHQRCRALGSHGRDRS
jgi:hypothetical protein